MSDIKDEDGSIKGRVQWATDSKPLKVLAKKLNDNLKSYSFPCLYIIPKNGEIKNHKLADAASTVIRENIGRLKSCMIFNHTSSLRHGQESLVFFFHREPVEITCEELRYLYIRLVEDLQGEIKYIGVSSTFEEMYHLDEWIKTVDKYEKEGLLRKVNLHEASNETGVLI